ncbi:3-hydroxyacyl-ACP dehydratase FabZ [Fructilactobacillus fructivorans]|uniref:3-hydroxyacyl-[acyl-carrier-protein] dehydratase n=1 Tax=Fructilactobacillus fructivorans TaxID=1614 RepID=A0A0C1PNA4_9LACO|nr:3-hydroxyacyl-ACP dehydratase FabZ [Fructilactobacillus fructivorans]KID42207.1 (3R)-hydroxymyristoyl-[acyl carrier protein] dehydratase [Fructilactobacillus fructivorans]MCT0151165.1 3-hydroxyacyl-ACP dehydratase FabZ [Fructilactobacillus fructivorans]MCT2867277.1 3-hydroxyacyl-ACP dehydratase FabZ [Fructilactobacillus fructivorans]MCT2869203.1 3-hydroxyacyl-ACP dehydratase FabZ [Fructilactobacillus fructivorans]MCT2873076.1 3-hydroxyacyl-ACP dehydratase FabZ [Fructilactobacillus fructivor
MEQLSIDKIMEILPNKNPTLFVDRVDQLTPGESIDAVKNVTANENYFQGHFPGFPLMPGVLIVETLSQVASILILKSIDEDPQKKETKLDKTKNVKFRHMVRPGDTLKVHVDLKEAANGRYVVAADGEVDGNKACSATLEFSLADRLD